MLTLSQEKLEYVDVIIELLELRDIEDAMIGQPGAGLGVEQRKRLTIGVELVSKPYVLSHYLYSKKVTDQVERFSSWTSRRQVSTVNRPSSSSPSCASLPPLANLSCVPFISPLLRSLPSSTSSCCSKLVERWSTVSLIICARTHHSDTD